MTEKNKSAWITWRAKLPRDLHAEIQDIAIREMRKLPGMIAVLLKEAIAARKAEGGRGKTHMLIRRLTPADVPIITQLILGDPDHVGMTAAFFDERRNKMSLCFEDDAGPVFYVRLDCDDPATVRVHIQFDKSIALRTARLLVEGFQVVRDRCRQAGAERIVFDSSIGALREFCMRRFGFRVVSGTSDLELYLLGEAGHRVISPI